MNTWILNRPERKSAPLVSDWFENSDIESHKFANTDPFPDSTKKISVKSHVSSSRFEGIQIFPTLLNCLVVRGSAFNILEKIAEDEFWKCELEIECLDGESVSFWAVKPKLEFACIDLERSEFEWLIPEFHIHRIERIVFRNACCLGGASFGREKFLGSVLASEELKDALLAVDKEGVAARLPENLGPGWHGK